MAQPSTMASPAEASRGRESSPNIRWWNEFRVSAWAAFELARRNIRAQYRQSVLGYWLSLCPALVAAAWCTAVRHAKVVNIPELDIPYPAFVVLSMMLWLTFIEMLYAPIEGLATDLPILARSSYSPLSFVLSRVLEVLFNFAGKLLVVIAAAAWFSLPLAPTIVFAPISFVLLLSLGLSLGLILAPFGALFHDVTKVLGMVTTFWFFLTPIIFPTPSEGVARWVVRLNPVTPLLTTTREWATTGVLSDPWGLAVMSILAPILLSLSWMFFRRMLPVVIECNNP